MGANRSGERRKRSIKRSLKNYRTKEDPEFPQNFRTGRGAIFRQRPVKKAKGKAKTKK